MTEMQWFLSPEGKMFRGRKSVLKFIQSNPDRFNPEDIRKFKSVPTQNKKFSAEYDWNENDPTLPEGLFLLSSFLTLTVICQAGSPPSST